MSLLVQHFRCLLQGTDVSHVDNSSHRSDSKGTCSIIGNDKRDTFALRQLRHVHRLNHSIHRSRRTSHRHFVRIQNGWNLFQMTGLVRHGRIVGVLGQLSILTVAFVAIRFQTGTICLGGRTIRFVDFVEIR